MFRVMEQEPMESATTWHATTVQELRDLLVQDAGAAALAVVGSAAGADVDAWSDLDVLVVVRPEAFARFIPDLGWLAPLGRIDAFRQHRDETRAVSRVCFEDLRRLDVIVATADALLRSGG
jgi:hypothetical protein